MYFCINDVSLHFLFWIKELGDLVFRSAFLVKNCMYSQLDMSYRFILTQLSWEIKRLNKEHGKPSPLFKTL